MKKRLPSLILTFAMVFCLVVPVFAVDTKESSQICACGATIRTTEEGTLKIVFNIMTLETMEIIGVSSIVIQRSTNTGWLTEHTYTLSNMPGMQTSNRASHAGVIPYTPNHPNATYRAIVNFYVKGRLGVSVATRTALQS